MEFEIESIDNLKKLLMPKDLHKRDGKYIIAATYKGEYVYLGRFDNIDEAKNILCNFRYNRLKETVEQYKLNLNDAKILDKNYIVFKTGDVFHMFGYKLTGTVNGHGYRQLTINHKTILLHRIVGFAFIENPNNYPFINHIDGNKLNNDINNLEWCTNQQNVQHAFKTGLKIPLRGEECAGHKLTEDQVRFIKSHYIPQDKKYGMRALGRTFGVSEYTIRQIIYNKNWKWVKIKDEN